MQRERETERAMLGLALLCVSVSTGDRQSELAGRPKHVVTSKLQIVNKTIYSQVVFDSLYLSLEMCAAHRRRLT